MKQILPKDIRKLVNRLNENELHTLYRIVGDRLRLLHRTKAMFAMRDFQVLDKVFFDYHGERKEGTVTRLNQKTITVTLDDGEHWNVAPDFLKRINTENTNDKLITIEHANRTRN